MQFALYLLFPLLSAIGLNELRNVVQLAWQSNRVETETLEATFFLQLQKIWLRRWRIIAWAALYLLLAGITFFIGLWTNNTLYVIMSGLSIVLFVWAIGFLAHKLADIYQQVTNYIESNGPLPDNLKPWLQYFGVLERKLHLIPTHGEEAKKFLNKIQDTYRIVMIIPLCFTFFLGLFPDLKIWIMTLIIFVGAMLWLLLVKLLGEDPKKTLRNLKLMVIIWVLGTLAVTKFMAIFPSVSIAWGVHFKPLVEQRVVSAVNDWLSPKAIVLPPAPTAAPVPSPKPNETVIWKNGVVTIGTTVKKNETDIVSSPPKVNDEPKPKNHLAAYAAERARKLKKDYPELLKSNIVPVPEIIVPLTPSADPAKPELESLPLPPVKQLPN